jgi:hypothetical protein
MEEPCPFDALPSGVLMRIIPPIALKQKKSKSVILTMRLDSDRLRLPECPCSAPVLYFTVLAPDLSRTTHNDSDSSLTASVACPVDSWRPSPWIKPSMLVQLDSRGSHASGLARFDPCKVGDLAVNSLDKSETRALVKLSQCLHGSERQKSSKSTSGDDADSGRSPERCCARCWTRYRTRPRYSRPSRRQAKLRTVRHGRSMAGRTTSGSPSGPEKPRSLDAQVLQRWLCCQSRPFRRALRFC